MHREYKGRRRDSEPTNLCSYILVFHMNIFLCIESGIKCFTSSSFKKWMSNRSSSSWSPLDLLACECWRRMSFAVAKCRGKINEREAIKKNAVERSQACCCMSPAASRCSSYWLCRSTRGGCHNLKDLKSESATQNVYFVKLCLLFQTTHFISHFMKYFRLSTDVYGNFAYQTTSKQTNNVLFRDFLLRLT